jgi:hypothetical protein
MMECSYTEDFKLLPHTAIGFDDDMTKKYRSMIAAIMPIERNLPEKAALQVLQGMVDSGTLQPFHVTLILAYLNSLPFYGVPDRIEETERAHSCQIAEMPWQYHRMVILIWPLTPVSELTEMTSLKELKRLAESETLWDDEQSEINYYLSLLPLRGVPEDEEEHERRHAFATSFLRQRDSASAGGELPRMKYKIVSSRYSPRAKWSLCQTVSTYWRMIANVMSLLLYASMVIGIVRAFSGIREMDIDSLIQRCLLAVSLAISARCAKHIAAIAGHKIKLFDGAVDPLPLRHAYELLALSIIAIISSMAIPYFYESGLVENFLFFVSLLAILPTIDEFGSRNVRRNQGK